MSEHTPEPWALYEGEEVHGVLDSIGRHLAEMWLRKDWDALANARRIVACVNACRGIETGVLEEKTTVGLAYMALMEDRDNQEREVGVTGLKLAVKMAELDQALRERDESLAQLDQLRKVVGEMGRTLERVRDEMEASGGWDGDEEVFQSVVDVLLKAEALR